MSESYRMWDHKRWAEAGLDDIMERHEMEYRNQDDDYGDSLCGEWYIADDETRTIIWGTFGNDHSPGCSPYTYAEVYGPDEEEAYRSDLAEWESKPEYTDEYLARGEEEDEEVCEEEDSEEEKDSEEEEDSLPY